MPRPRPIPCASAVFPAPSSPLSPTMSPDASSRPRISPRACVSSGLRVVICTVSSPLFFPRPHSLTRVAGVRRVPGGRGGWKAARGSRKGPDMASIGWTVKARWLLAGMVLGAGAVWGGSGALPIGRPAQAAPAAPAEDGKLRIIVFGAHPDDCELRAAGAAAKWAARGDHVKFVSVTNGDIGHWRSAGGPLAQRRAAEVRKAAGILGITNEVMDVH